jgi:hypothetical protein
MKGLEIEACAKLLLCPIAELKNVELADFVAESLCWPCKVPVNLVGNAVGVDVSQCLLPRPTLRVNACVDDEANCA